MALILSEYINVKIHHARVNSCHDRLYNLVSIHIDIIHTSTHVSIYSCQDTHMSGYTHAKMNQCQYMLLINYFITSRLFIYS